MGKQMIEYAQELIDIFRFLHKDFKTQIMKKTCVLDITVPQMMLMAELYKNPDITLNELSKKLGLSKSTVSGIVDRLVDAGFVIREIPKENRRIVKLSLSKTAKEQHQFKNIIDEYLLEISKILESVGEEETENIINALRKLKEAAENYTKQE